MKIGEYRYSDTYPPDGVYLCRMDEDDEPMTIEVKDGVAFKNCKRQIIYGFEWKAINKEQGQW